MVQLFKRWFSKSPEAHPAPVSEVVADGSVVIEGKTYALKRWTRKSFVASPSGPHFNDGDEVSIDVSVRLGVETLEFSGLAMIVEVDLDADEVECRFLDIDRAAEPALDRHFKALAADATVSADG